jgi:hypothetical protein
LSEPKISPDDERLYIIQSGDGGVAGWNQIDAELLWLVSCDQFEKGCSNAVRAEFSLSRDGQFLYYGDVDGRVIAVKLGEFVTPVPTVAPVPAPPTPVIILNPTTGLEWPPPPDLRSQEEENKQVNIGVSMGGSIALIVMSATIAVGAVMYITMAHRFRTHPHPQQEPHPIGEVGQIDSPGSHHTSDFEDAPDAYEDAIIFKKRVGRSHATEYDPKRQFSNDDLYENTSVAPPADRLSLVLGTSNLIQPISPPGTPGAEDYSFGASLLV